MRRLKQSLPIITFVLASSAALSVGNGDALQMQHKGHLSNGLKCIPTDVMCTNVQTGIICRDGSDKALYQNTGQISCAYQLWKPIQ